jgi:hypothetical protein
MPVDEITVLACSKKKGGRCVAGISQNSGEWVRPVSDGPFGRIEAHQFRIDGREVQPLDIVRFDHDGNCGDPTQPENVLVEHDQWLRTGRLDSAEAYAGLSAHLATGPGLLGNQGAAVIEKVAMEGMEASLALIEPESIRFSLELPWKGKGAPRPRAIFSLAGAEYDLGVTDTLVRPRLMNAGYGDHSPAELGLQEDMHTLLTVSLAELRDGWCTKLVAAVLFLP